MYYEEKVIDGILYSRSAPNAEWREATGPYADAVHAMFALDDDQRRRVFRNFCTSCGGDDPSCQCWNDE